MNTFTSPGFWLIFAAVLVIFIAVLVRHERTKHNRPTQRRGVNPGDPNTQIIANNLVTGTKLHFVTSDPQAIAKAFVPSDRRD